MPKLTLKHADNIISEHILEPGKQIRIGRDATNDIVITNAHVSTFHAEIESEEAEFYLHDRQSRNGTFINKQLIISQRLKHGDVITLGKHTLEFDYPEQAPEAESEAPRSKQRTVAMDTSQHRSQIAKGLSEIVVQKETQKEKQALLTDLSGRQKDIKLTKALTTIGKAQSSDIRVRGLLIGKTVAVIEKRNDGHILRYVKGFIKPQVNYQAVKTEAALKEFDVIKIGAALFQFHYR